MAILQDLMNRACVLESFCKFKINITALNLPFLLGSNRLILLLTLEHILDSLCIHLLFLPKQKRERIEENRRQQRRLPIMHIVI